jgi:periplasmic protein TonB
MERQAMFEDSLLESSGKLARRSPWTTAISFAAQAVLGAFVVLLSLLYTDALPVHTIIGTLEAPPPPAQAPAVTHVVSVERRASEIKGGVLVPPTEIPRHASVIHDQLDAVEPSAQPGTGVLNSLGNSSNSMITELLRSTPVSAPKAAVLPKVRVSLGIAQGLLLRQVKPQYPSLARQARIQGSVVLEAVIGRDGTIQELRVVSGHPMLTPAAIEAVKQWRYRPYLLNGEPVAVDTQINVNFTLSN